MAVLDRAGLERLLQQLMQIGTVDVDEGTAEARLAGFVELQPVERLAAVPGAADEGIGLYAGRREALLEIETPQHLGDIGAENDAGADAREARRRLIHRDAKARALQQSCDRQAGQSGAQNCNPCSAIHPLTLFNRVACRGGPIVRHLTNALKTSEARLSRKGVPCPSMKRNAQILRDY